MRRRNHRRGARIPGNNGHQLQLPEPTGMGAVIPHQRQRGAGLCCVCILGLPRTRTHTYTYTQTCTHIHTHTQTNKHTHTHTHTNTCWQSPVLQVFRGVEYTFRIMATAQHPMYITNDIIGGRANADIETVFAGRCACLLACTTHFLWYPPSPLQPPLLTGPSMSPPRIGSAGSLQRRHVGHGGCTACAQVDA